MNSRYCRIVILCLLINQRILSGSTSEKRIDVSAIEGENVTLRVQEERQIKDISWFNGSMDHFATITPDGNVDIRETRYKGRLRCSDNASLTITNVTLEEQGLYTASILLSDVDSTYRQMYNLRILAKLPDNNAFTEASIADPCSVSCRINGSDVILICGNTSSRDITELYDPEICSCLTWNPDSSRCILEESCREDDNTGRSHVGVLLTILIFVGVVFVVLSRTKNPSVKKPSVYQKIIQPDDNPFCSEGLKPSGDQEDLESARTSLPTTNVPEAKTAVTQSGDQESEVEALLRRNKEIFSEVAGQSTIFVNANMTMPDFKVNLMPSRLPGR